MASFSNWQEGALERQIGLTPFEGGPPIHIRNALEAKRLAWRTTPGEDYPSGYLGTVSGGRHERLTPVARSYGRSYQRGVHAGSRVDMSYYLWPQEFHLMSGIENQARTGRRFVSAAYGEDTVVLTNDGRPGPQDNMGAKPNAQGVPVRPDVQRQADLRRGLPSWR